MIVYTAIVVLARTTRRIETLPARYRPQATLIAPCALVTPINE